MSKTIKIWLIAAAALIVLGLILFAGAMAAFGFDFAKLSTVRYQTNSYEVNGAFDKISIDVDTTEIEFVPSDDEGCRIVCLETEKVKHSAVVQDGTLVIDIADTRKWYDHIGIFLETPKMTVYLPQENYASLFIDTDTGDIAIPNDFAFENLEINGDTSDVECFAPVSNVMDVKLSTGSIKVDDLTAGRLSLTTTTGEINVISVTAKDDIDIETDTGAVKLTDVSCTDFTAEGDTGTIFLKNVVAAGSFSIENDTGDVRFENSDAAQISVKTSTGDVAGTLLTEKVFFAETSTGDVSVPKTTAGGRCEIITGTGNIRIDVQ